MLVLKSAKMRSLSVNVADFNVTRDFCQSGLWVYIALRCGSPDLEALKGIRSTRKVEKFFLGHTERALLTASRSAVE